MKLQTPSNVFDMTKCLMKLQEKYLESVRYEFNLSRIEIIILTFLHNNPSYDSARDIVEFRMLQRGNVSAAVDTLEKKGYLTRDTDPDDKRIIHLKQTILYVPLRKSRKHLYYVSLQDFRRMKRRILQRIMHGCIKM